MLDKAFQATVSAYKPIVELSHKQEVMRLYRKCLRNLSSWVESRALFNEEASKVRAEFNANRSVPVDSAKAKRLVREAKERLYEQTHPDPYIKSYMPGGTLFMRNPAIPLEVIYPDGIPAELSKRRLNIDMSNVPDDQPYADKAFVDTASKQYWINK